MHHEKSEGESFVSVLYKKYDDDDDEHLEFEILVAKSAPGYASELSVSVYDCCYFLCIRGHSIITSHYFAAKLTPSPSVTHCHVW